MISYQCSHGDHEKCLRTWIGHRPGKSHAELVACQCDCGHRSQKRAAKAVKQMHRRP